MQTQQEFVPTTSAVRETKRGKGKGRGKNTENQAGNIPHKKAIRKEKNRLAAQKSRDRKQEYVQNMEKENRHLKIIISRCTQCTLAHRQFTQSEDFNQEEEQIPILEEREVQEEVPAIGSPPTWNTEQIFLRQEDSSSSNLSKYFWFCLVAVVICVLCMSGDVQDPPRILVDLNPNSTEMENDDKNMVTGNSNVLKGSNKKVRANSVNGNQNIIMGNSNSIQGNVNKIFSNYLDSKIQGLINLNKTGSKNSGKNSTAKHYQKCMECIRNMTSNNTFSHSLATIKRNFTNETNATSFNNTRKILFCKSKALFFKKIYSALKNDTSGSVAVVQTTGKNLEKLMDKDCFADSYIDEDQLYTIEFTVAIMELSPVKKSKPKNLTRHFTVNE